MEITWSGIYLLFKKQMVEDRIRYLLGALFMAVFLSGFMMFYTASRNEQRLNSSDVDAIFDIALISFGSIFTISLFDKFNSKRRALWLALPVSATDRSICIILSSLVLFPIVFCLMFGLSINVTSHLYPLLDAEMTARKMSDYYDMHIPFLSRYLLCQTCIAIAATYYRRYVYLAAMLTVTLSFAFFSSYYRSTLKWMFAIPAVTSDMAEVDVYDAPEKWPRDKTVEVWFKDISRDEADKKTVQKVKERVTGSISGTMYGYVFIDLATAEPAIMPVARYFRPTMNGALSKWVYKAFSIVLYIGFVLGWVVVCLRLKEAQI